MSYCKCGTLFGNTRYCGNCGCKRDDGFDPNLRNSNPPPLNPNAVQRRPMTNVNPNMTNYGSNNPPVYNNSGQLSGSYGSNQRPPQQLIYGQPEQKFQQKYPKGLVCLLFVPFLFSKYS